MRLSVPHTVSLMACTLIALAACSAMEQARLDELDRSVTVSTSDPLYRYERVGLEAASCEGRLCANVSARELERVVEQGAMAACYEVVSAEEVERYAKHYGGPRFGFGTGVDHLGPDGNAWAGFTFRFDTFQPDVRDVVVGELGIEAILKTALTIGEPEATTGWHPFWLDLRLVDARGRQTLWQARLHADLMDNQDVGALMQRLGMDVRDALTRRASACGRPSEQPTEAFPVRNERIELPDRIHFELGSTELSRRSHRMLREAAAFITRSDFVKVRVEGHTDSDGGDNENLALSEARAAAVVEFLVQAGVQRGRLEARGYGETRPHSSEATLGGKAANRRVDLVIVR